METIVAALIGGFVTLLVAFLAVGPKLKALSKQVEVHDKDSVGRKQELSKEHEMLSKIFGDTLSRIHGAVSFLKEGRIADEAKRDSAKGQASDMQKAMDSLQNCLLHMLDLESKMGEVLQENYNLRLEIDALRQELEQGQDRDGEELEH